MATAKDNQHKIENAVRIILSSIGEDPNRAGLKETPQRVARMYNELFRGYDKKQRPNVTIFENGKDGVQYDEMILDSGYFYSVCEHHMIPFFGHYYFAYIPKHKILGISKVARIVDYYAAKLQVQERLTTQIVDDLQSALEPEAIGLVMKAQHLCREMRGVKKVNGEMTTSVMRGLFRLDSKSRQEFLQLSGLLARGVK